MRSKEVDEAIGRIKQLQQFIKRSGTGFCFFDNENSVIAYESLGKVLNYISELEEKVENYMKLSASSLARELNESIKNKEKNKTDLELLNEGWKQMIRDKIKELENKAISYGHLIDRDESFNIQSKISVLKEILEGE